MASCFDTINPFFPVQPDDDVYSSRDGCKKEICKRSLKTIQKEKDDIQSINSALKKNISCLFKTAKTELQRKENTINQLEQKNKSLQNELLVTRQEMMYYKAFYDRYNNY